MAPTAKVRAVPLIAAIMLLGFPAGANAAMEAFVTDDNVVVVAGDDGNDRVRVLDGINSGGGPTDIASADDYGAQLIDEDGGPSGGPIPTTDPKCFQAGVSTFCGGNIVQVVYVAPGGGNDEVIAGGFSFSQLAALAADFGPGDDRTSGGWNGLALTANGDEGEDHLFGGTFDDTLNGGEGNDEMLGSTGDDTLHGDAGNDDVNGGGENDEVYGDSGNDSVIGSADSDTVDGGSGTDDVVGDGGTFTEGNDRINVDDGERDTVTCGGGTGDSVTADQLDEIAVSGCEAVTRSGQQQQQPFLPPPETRQETAQDQLAPGITKAALAGKPKLRASLKKGFDTFVTTTEGGAATIEGQVSGKDARGLKLAATKVAARGRATLPAAAGKYKVRVRFTKKAQKKFRRARKLKLTLKVAVVDAAGNRGERTAKVTLKR
jgi:Ca2+-binding RTX toxin-like protein